MSDERRKAEWFNQGSVASKEANGLCYEVWANGTFACTAPNGDRFKSHNSALTWLTERGITNDEQLNGILNSENGWDTDMNRWFELIVFDVVKKDGLNHCSESYSDDNVCYDYDDERFNTWIDEAIESDAREVSE